MDVLTEPAITSRGGRPRWRLGAYWPASRRATTSRWPPPAAAGAPRR